MVYATSRDEAKRDRAVALGAAAAFDSDADWPVTVDVVVESVGPATWDRSVRALRPGGRLVVCGGTSGPKVELNLPRLFFKQIEIIGSTMGSYPEFDEVTALVGQGLDVHVDEVLDRTDYPAALERLRRASSSARSCCVIPVESPPPARAGDHCGWRSAWPPSRSPSAPWCWPERAAMSRPTRTRRSSRRPPPCPRRTATACG